jgi:PAS domain S-box-containing protein
MKNEKRKVKKVWFPMVLAFQGVPLSFFFLLFSFFFFLSCEKAATPVDTVVRSPFASFRDVPGVTAKEIADIEKLQKERASFVFGNPYTAEAFIKENGENGGFQALLSGWLSGLFGIPFEQEIYPSDELNQKILAREVDFGGNMGISAERLKTFYMTDVISERQYRIFRLRGSRPLDQIARERLPRYAFLPTAGAWRDVAAVTKPGSYENVWINNYEEAYPALISGQADAFIGPRNAESHFITREDVYSDDFYPLIFGKVSLYTANPALEPIILVVTKALRAGAKPYMTRLYEDGYRDYMKYKMSVQLNKTEHEYIASHPVVPIVANYDNYPLCFYNTREGEWQGIFFDLMDEVSELTGLTFNIINKNNDDWPVIYEMARTGEASLIADLVWSQERAEHFIWPETGIQPDYFALLSKSDYRDIMINEVGDAKVGVAQDTIHASTFKQWFPNHPKTVEYENMDGALLALQQGEVDMVMSTQRRLMFLTHFMELSGYKTNIVFDLPIQTISGVNNNEEDLCSIIDKAFKIIDTKGISERWMRRTFDYRMKLTEARLPWLIGATAMTLIALALIIITFLRNFNARKLKEAEAKTRETDERAKIMFDTAPFAICMFDKDFNMIDCNQELVKIFGIPDKEFFLKRHSELFPEYQPDGRLSAEVSAENVRIAFEKGYHHFECMHRKLNGAPLPVESTLLRVKYRDKYVIAAHFRDLTEQKAMVLLARQQAEAEAASRAKSSFLANMSHEMRTPMNVIVGLTDLMLEEDEPGNIKETLKKINTAGNTLMSLINDVLDISKVEAGKMELMPVRYDVASLLNDIIVLNMIRIENKPITFKLDINENLPASLFGDDLRVKQILNNLLSNAFKYTRKGTVTLGVKYQPGDVLESANPGDTPCSSVWLSFYISDTGIGMRKEDMAKLFTDYHQVDTSAHREITGTGLGLSITKKMVDLSGGEISVESEYGKGTTFRVLIRQGFVDDKAIGKEIAENLRSFCYLEKKKQTQEKLVRPNLSYARVLVVDDYPTNQDVAAGMLRKYKMQVDCVDNGQAAIDFITAGKPVYDAIFMDHMMPEMDGVEAVKAIRALDGDYAKNIPIIALTANAVAESEKMFLENGFNAFLPKPFNVMTLDSVVQRWVRNKAKE